MLHSDGNESGQPFESVEVDALRRLEGALEAKGSAERRVSEIEGHLDNMRAVLSQYETRKRVQSCVIEDLETQVSELAAENETLRSRLQELQQNLQAESLKTRDSVPWQDFSEGRQALGGSIAELRHLLCDVRLGYTEAWRMREARLREMKDRQAELDMLRSVFPPMLSRGLPRRHHIVTYLLLQSTQSHLQLQDRLCPEPREVSGCVWVDPSLVRAIVSTVDGAEHSGKAPANLPQTVRVTEVCSDGALLTSELPVAVLLNTAPPEGPDVERISTGTKYALELWLKAMETGPDSTSTQQ
ncbi:UNVERIFIED_CONTAM: hypothetical protein FKN15_012316 [Acipenser sinensis]